MLTAPEPPDNQSNIIKPKTSNIEHRDAANHESKRRNSGNRSSKREDSGNHRRDSVSRDNKAGGSGNHDSQKSESSHQNINQGVSASQRNSKCEMPSGQKDEPKQEIGTVVTGLVTKAATHSTAVDQNKRKNKACLVICVKNTLKRLVIIS